ncbi:MAG: glycosyltransferase family 39 protein [Chloroflexi bacterium]|nr:glycosyltransferase family 39 protein [Chloroflexota bacterium]
MRVQKYLSTESITLFLILMLAAFFRFYRLDAIPPSLYNDEAFNLLDILDVLRGQFSIFFPANTGREPLWLYLNTATVASLGASVFVLRVSAALIGTITVGLLYGFARTLFRSRTIAALAACFLAISTWHLFSSRNGLRIILAAMLTLLALWWFWRGLGNPTHRRFFAFTGFCTALALYTHVTSRLLPFLLLELTLFALLVNRARARDYVIGLVITGLVALLIFLPLGVYFATHFDDFMGHTTNLSIFDPRVSQGNVPLTLWQNTILVMGSFLVNGDHEPYRNIPFRPIFDPFTGTFFIIGVAVALATIFMRRSTAESRVRAFLLTAWLALWMMATITSDDPPNFLRMLPGVSAAMMLAAWGVSTVWNRLRGETFRRTAAVTFAAMMIVSTGLAYRDYFEFAQSDFAYLGFEGHVSDAASWVNQNALTSQVYMAPLWAIHGTMRLLTRNTPWKSYESRDTVVLPSNATGRDALMVYPWEQEKKAQKLGERLGTLGVRETVTGTFGFPVAVAIRVPAKNLPDAQNPLAVLDQGSDFVKPQKIEHAVWADSFELLGYSIQATDIPKRNLEVTLFIRALQSIPEDYTFSVKACDDKERAWGQDDKWLGDNSYATTQWSPGDVIIEKFYPGLNACAPAGAYRVSVEAYNPKTMQTLALSDRPGALVSLGTTRAEASQGNRLVDLEIYESLDVQVAPQVSLLGYTLTPQEPRAGTPFSLSLFWNGVGDGNKSIHTVVKLRDATKKDFVLVDQNILLPADGRGRCTFFDLTAPQIVSMGPAAILVNDVQIGTLSILR